MTILKDDELNYDCDVWFLKERKKYCTMESDCNRSFFYLFIYFLLLFCFLNPSQVKGWQIFHKHRMLNLKKLALIATKIEGKMLMETAAMAIPVPSAILKIAVQSSLYI